MKRTIAVLLTLVLALSVLSACSININLGNEETEAPAASVPQVDVPTAAPVTEPQTEAPPQIGELEDYVGVYKQKEVSFSDGNTNTLRLPEILIDSADAKDVNAEIVDKFGDIVNGDAKSTGAYALDYEAYLNDEVLSVIIIAGFDGGNTYGLAYNFDVLTGESLSNRDLCDAVGKDYSSVKADLKDGIEDVYNEKFGSLPGNDTEKEKTFSNDNINDSVIYLDGNGRMKALVKFYAAVGGGQFVAQINL